MSRFILSRDQGKTEPKMIPEAKIEQEEILQEAMKEHPQLIPAADFGLGDLLVVGREASAGNGRIDLLCVDQAGQIAIIEMKRGPENSDSRRVVAQALEYGAHFWEMTAEDFQERALTYFRSDRCSQRELRGVTSLKEALDLVQPPAPSDGDIDLCNDGDDDLLKAIAENLSAGSFVYIIVSSMIDESLRRVMRYLNSTTNFTIGAVEVDYFADSGQEFFVPRPILESAVKRPRNGSARTTRDRFLADVTPEGRSFFERLFTVFEDLGGKIEWGTKGCACRLPYRGRPISLMQCYPATVWWLKDKNKNQIDIVTKSGGPSAQPTFDIWKKRLDSVCT